MATITLIDLLWLAMAVYFGVHWSYVAIMAAKAKRAQLTPYWYAVLTPLIVIGFVLDILFNLTFGLMFLEKPRWELMFSSRVQRHYRHSTGWRKRLAVFWARNLNVFDDHIKE
jgi:hypothetical protein